MALKQFWFVIRAKGMVYASRSIESMRSSEHLVGLIVSSSDYQVTNLPINRQGAETQRTPRSQFNSQVQTVKFRSSSSQLLRLTSLVSAPWRLIGASSTWRLDV